MRLRPRSPGVFHAEALCRRPRATDDVHTNFMEASVAQSGATEASCGDCLVALENEYTFDEFVALDAAMREGTVEPAEQERFDAIVAECGE